MILAAGRGERMRPLTDILPKPLLPLNGKPLMQYHLEKLQNTGIKRVIINHAWLGHKIEAAFGDGRQFGFDIHYSAETEALETAGGIVKALPLLGDAPFLVVNGDVYADVDFAPLLHSPLQALAKLLLVTNPEHHPEGDFSLVDGKLREKQPQLNSFTFSGIALYHPDFFAGLRPEKMRLAPLIRKHIATGQVQGEWHRGKWCDVGTPERLAQLEEELQA
ncbi:nucleotidyltransferase family protein [Planctobacterium marinum]|nr:nucleotidyltransferase family protein [Planctobacterium marinum]MCC2605129.1 nucleotidyltransferase family protein [Planctobacterium marinum]